MSVICRIIEKPAATVFSYLRYHGGIEPRARVRRLSAPSIREREEISRGMAAGASMRSIALRLGRSPSTISREIQRNGGSRRYRAADVDLAADKAMQISHETIYKSLFIQTWGVFKKELRKHLRTGRKFRHSRKHQSGYRQRIIDGVSISERPACVADRAVPGHWEGDLICGAGIAISPLLLSGRPALRS